MRSLWLSDLRSFLFSHHFLRKLILLRIFNHITNHWFIGDVIPSMTLLYPSLGSHVGLSFHLSKVKDPNFRSRCLYLGGQCECGKVWAQTQIFMAAVGHDLIHG